MLGGHLVNLLVYILNGEIIVSEALEIDKASGNTLWYDAIKIEIKDNHIALLGCKGDMEDLKITIKSMVT